MARSAWILAGLALAACNGDKGATDDTGGVTGTTPESCTVTVDGTFPTDGTTDHYFLADLEFELSEADSTGSVAVTDSAGGEVTGTSSWSDDGETLYFTADGGLSPETNYTATLSLCGGELTPSIDFSTSDLGTARDCDLSDRGYLVDLTEARFVEPAGVADLLLGQLENNVLLGVSGYADSDYIDVVGAISTDAGTDQDFCTESIDFSGVDFASDPTFSLGPQDTELSVAGYDIMIGSLEISGTFASDCSYFGGGKLAGELDARLLAPLMLELLDTDDPDYICQLISGFGVTCGECSSDGESYCLDILADSIVATELSTTVECVAASDCHESCATVGEDCDTSDYPTCE